MKVRLVFIANNLNIGGPQKGLVALLDELDDDIFDVTVVSMQPGGELRAYIERNTAVKDVSTLARAAQMNRETPLRDVWTLFRYRRFRAIWNYVCGTVARITNRPVNPWRQRAWSAAHVPLRYVTRNVRCGFCSVVRTRLVLPRRLCEQSPQIPLDHRRLQPHRNR